VPATLVIAWPLAHLLGLMPKRARTRRPHPRDRPVEVGAPSIADSIEALASS